ncbi:MAG: FAD-binding protein [Lentisphaeria bacterium]|jgi:UDP-N-acetylmuramate--alanine ligase|nr:FAD-binding protein [Lentisphaeria bacterium]
MANLTDQASRLPWRAVHFVGAGGVGMAGLAHILADWGVTVTGTDAAESAMLASLAARGLDVRVPHGGRVPEGTELVVYSNAVPAGNAERLDAAAKGIPSCLRGEFLARLAAYFSTVVSVAGSHGKTTTAAMLAHILRHCGADPGFLVGGSLPGWPRAAAAGGRRVLVTEVDESDGTQALMRSRIAVVLNVEDDHCWSLGGIEALEQCFRTFAGRADQVLAWESPATRRLFADHPAAVFLGEDDLPAELSVPGRHNRINGALALAAAVRLGVDRAAALAALRGFPGVDRRLSVRHRSASGHTVLVEDYAHHPTELRAALAALRESYPGHSLQVVFQPHRFERVLRYGAEFGALLATADRVVVYRPFAAWREDAGLADPAAIVRGIPPSVPARYATESLAELAGEVVSSLGAEPSVVAVIGAGDIHGLVALLRRELVSRELDALAAVSGAPPLARVAWADLTTLGVGAGRPLLAEPRDEAEARAVLAFARERGLAVLPLGRGSNLVGTDEEQPVLALRLAGEFARWEMVGDRVRAGAGVSLGSLARGLAAQGRCPEALLALAWIPATVGGAARMNAGAEGCDFAGLVSRLRGLRLADGTAVERRASAVAWSYRDSDLEGLLVTEVWIDLPPAGDAAGQQERLAEFGRRRAARQPRGRSAGCVFRNPPGDSAGRLLDACGAKGMRAGGAEVSAVHANFFLAGPDTREADFVALLHTARQRVAREHGIVLDFEVRLLGEAAREKLGLG